MFSFSFRFPFGVRFCACVCHIGTMFLNEISLALSQSVWMYLKCRVLVSIWKCANEHTCSTIFQVLRIFCIFRLSSKHFFCSFQFVRQNSSAVFFYSLSLSFCVSFALRIKYEFIIGQQCTVHTAQYVCFRAQCNQCQQIVLRNAMCAHTHETTVKCDIRQIFRHHEIKDLHDGNCVALCSVLHAMKTNGNANFQQNQKEKRNVPKCTENRSWSVFKSSKSNWLYIESTIAKYSCRKLFENRCIIRNQLFQQVGYTNTFDRSDQVFNAQSAKWFMVGEKNQNKVVEVNETSMKEKKSKHMTEIRIMFYIFVVAIVCVRKIRARSHPQTKAINVRLSTFNA